MTALQILLVGAGSALGGMARFVLSQILRMGGRFPWATLAVNVVGSLAFGILAGWLAKAGSGEWVRSVRFFAIVGIWISPEAKPSREAGAMRGAGLRLSRPSRTRRLSSFGRDIGCWRLLTRWYRLQGDSWLFTSGIGFQDD